MSMMVQSGRFGSSAVPVTQTDWSNISSGSSVNITGRSIGAASATRWVIVALAINYNAGRTINTVTIGGVSATRLFASPSSLGVAGSKTEYWAANVPTGTTATIAATLDGSMFDGSLFIWTADREPVFFDGKEDLTVSSGSYSLAIDVPEGGAVLVVCNNNAGTTTVNAISGWATGFISTVRDILSGKADLLPAQTGRTISITLSGGSPNPTYDGLSAISVSF